MKQFTKDNLATLRKEINEALAAVAQKNGISLNIGNISFTDNTFGAKLTSDIVQVVPRMSAEELQNKRFKKVGGNSYYTVIGKSPIGVVIITNRGKRYNATVDQLNDTKMFVLA